MYAMRSCLSTRRSTKYWKIGGSWVGDGAECSGSSGTERYKGKIVISSHRAIQWSEEKTNSVSGAAGETDIESGILGDQAVRGS